MTEELFTSAFREMFRYPEASSPEELACEKAFLLCGGYRPGGRYQPILGIFALEELLRNERTKQVLEEVYNYTPATFYGEMAQHLFLDEFVIRDMEAERQQFGREKEDLQREVERLEADTAEMAAKISARDGTIQTLQTELRTITGSRSWKATAPIRKVLDQIKRK